MENVIDRYRIYRELLNTANLYERIEIEKHALKSESVRNSENFVKAATWIPELNITADRPLREQFCKRYFFLIAVFM
jgi:hypothetical protein